MSQIILFFKLGASSEDCFPFKLHLSFFVADSPLPLPGFGNSPIWDLFFTCLLAWIFIQRITYIWALINETFIRCVGWLEVLFSCYGKSQVSLVLSGHVFKGRSLVSHMNLGSSSSLSGLSMPASVPVWTHQYYGSAEVLRGFCDRYARHRFCFSIPIFFFCLLWVSFCWPFSAFPFLLLFLGCQFKCIPKTFIQHFYFCSKKDRVSLAHFLVKKYILNLACCFLKATIINKLKIPFYCEFLVNTILTEICLILWMHLIEHLYFFILKWTINAKINIVNMNVFHKLDPLCIYYCLVSF